jgi:voltage-gated potassium channel Kch
MQRKPSLRERFRYWFDNRFTGGPLAVIGWLMVGTLALVLLMTFVSLIPGIQPEGQSLKEIFWTILYQALTPNPYDPTIRSQFLIVMLVVTIGSLLIVSILIGTLTSGISDKLGDLRKGRSRVLENGHVLILGWSAQIFTIIQELIITNDRHKKFHIVILAEKDKVAMEDEIRLRIKALKKTQVICRRGNPIDITDLEIANPHTARSIIILPPESNDPDAEVIKTILALTNNPNRSQEMYHIVTQIREQKNMDVVKLISERDNVQAVLTGEMVARVVAQTSRQSGLSLIYTDLLNFEGDEIYFKEEPSLVGKSFEETLFSYEDSAVIGLCLADGSIELMPSLNYVLKPGDSIIAISENEGTVLLSGLSKFPVDEESICTSHAPQILAPENTLILGWNRIGIMVIRELDAYVAEGSRLMVIADPEASRQVARIKEGIEALERQMHHQRIFFERGDTTNRQLLDNLNLAEYDHVIVLSYAGLDVQEADARTLATLLHLRHISEKNNTPFSIVSEMLDLRNRELAEVTHVDDFIVSDHLVSLMMAQLAENGDLFEIFNDIFDPIGPEIYLKPVADYVQTGKSVNFYTVIEAARRRGEVPIGYRLIGELDDKSKAYGVHTNPKKSESMIFTPEDRIIVLAEGQV